MSLFYYVEYLAPRARTWVKDGTPCATKADAEKRQKAIVAPGYKFRIRVS